MKIVSLVAENVKRIVAVEIKPDGNLVELTGKNGAGKTSILDSIWWALAGAGHVQAEPIRKGQKEARIRLDLGECIVTRRFKKLDDGTTDTTVTVESANGARFGSPQKLLDSFLGALSFDPLAFSRMAPRQQFDALRRFVPDVNFEEIDGLNRRDFEARTSVNRRAREARAAAGSISVPADLPDGWVDESEIVAELEQAGARNTEIAEAKASRARAAEQVEAKKAAAADKRREAEQLRQEAERLRNQADRKDEVAGEFDREAARLVDRLAALPPLAEPIDTAAVRARIDDARRHNGLARRRDDKANQVKLAAELDAEAERLTRQIAERTADKAKRIEAAKLPIDGLGFGDGQVLLNGVPFGQGSDAEQLRASVAIAMAGSPKLRVIRVRDGSLLDAEGMKLLAEMANAQDMQVWVERVAADGKVGFVIEDGQVKQTPSHKEQPA